MEELVVHVVGARPNFVKMAPLITALADRGVDRQIVVHTGQHYDRKMSDEILEDLDFPQPGPFAGRRLRKARRADREGPDGLRGGPGRGAARGRRRCGRRELDARVRPGGVEARHSRGAPRVRPPVGRLDHARGDQPRPHGSPVRPAVHTQPRGRGEPGGRGHRPLPGALRREHDDRLAPPLRGQGARARRVEGARARGRASMCS